MKFLQIFVSLFVSVLLLNEVVAENDHDELKVYDSKPSDLIEEEKFENSARSSIPRPTADEITQAILEGTFSHNKLSKTKSKEEDESGESNDETRLELLNRRPLLPIKRGNKGSSNSKKPSGSNGESSNTDSGAATGLSPQVVNSSSTSTGSFGVTGILDSSAQNGLSSSQSNSGSQGHTNHHGSDSSEEKDQNSKVGGFLQNFLTSLNNNKKHNANNKGGFLSGLTTSLSNALSNSQFSSNNTSSSDLLGYAGSTLANALTNYQLDHDKNIQKENPKGNQFTQHQFEGQFVPGVIGIGGFPNPYNYYNIQPGYGSQISTQPFQNLYGNSDQFQLQGYGGGYPYSNGQINYGQLGVYGSGLVSRPQYPQQPIVTNGNGFLNTAGQLTTFTGGNNGGNSFTTIQPTNKLPDNGVLINPSTYGTNNRGNTLYNTFTSTNTIPNQVGPIVQPNSGTNNGGGFLYNTFTSTNTIPNQVGPIGPVVQPNSGSNNGGGTLYNSFSSTNTIPNQVGPTGPVIKPNSGTSNGVYNTFTSTNTIPNQVNPMAQTNSGSQVSGSVNQGIKNQQTTTFQGPQNGNLPLLSTPNNFFSLSSDGKLGNNNQVIQSMPVVRPTVPLFPGVQVSGGYNQGITNQQQTPLLGSQNIGSSTLFTPNTLGINVGQLGNTNQLQKPRPNTQLPIGIQASGGYNQGFANQQSTAIQSFQNGIMPTLDSSNKLVTVNNVGLSGNINKVQQPSPGTNPLVNYAGQNTMYTVLPNAQPLTPSQSVSENIGGNFNVGISGGGISSNIVNNLASLLGGKQTTTGTINTAQSNIINKEIYASSGVHKGPFYPGLIFIRPSEVYNAITTANALVTYAGGPIAGFVPLIIGIGGNGLPTVLTNVNVNPQSNTNPGNVNQRNPGVTFTGSNVNTSPNFNLQSKPLQVLNPLRPNSNSMNANFNFQPGKIPTPSTQMGYQSSSSNGNFLINKVPFLQGLFTNSNKKGSQSLINNRGPNNNVITNPNQLNGALGISSIGQTNTNTQGNSISGLNSGSNSQTIANPPSNTPGRPTLTIANNKPNTNSNNGALGGLIPGTNSQPNTNSFGASPGGSLPTANSPTNTYSLGGVTGGASGSNSNSIIGGQGGANSQVNANLLSGGSGILLGANPQANSNMFTSGQGGILSGANTQSNANSLSGGIGGQLAGTNSQTNSNSFASGQGGALSSANSQAVANSFGGGLFSGANSQANSNALAGAQGGALSGANSQANSNSLGGGLGGIFSGANSQANSNSIAGGQGGTLSSANSQAISNSFGGGLGGLFSGANSQANSNALAGAQGGAQSGANSQAYTNLFGGGLFSGANSQANSNSFASGQGGALSGANSQANAGGGNIQGGLPGSGSLSSSNAQANALSGSLNPSFPFNQGLLYNQLGNPPVFGKTLQSKKDAEVHGRAIAGALNTYIDYYDDM